MKLRSLGNLQPKMVIAMNEIEFALLCVQMKVALLTKIQHQTQTHPKERGNALLISNKIRK